MFCSCYFICSLSRVVESGLYKFWKEEVQYAVGIGHVDTRNSVKVKERYEANPMDLSIFGTIFFIYSIAITVAAFVAFFDVIYRHSNIKHERLFIRVGLYY